MSVLLAIVATLAVAYAALNLAALVWNRCLALPRRGAFPAVSRLLVVAPHQDDEAIMAGGLMSRLSGAGADVRVIVVTDGATARPGRTEAEVQARQQLRNEETLTALATIGIACDRISFLGIPAEQGLRSPEVVKQGIERLARAMMHRRPEAVITTAFEGGHPDHDATNFMVSRAAQKAGLSADRVFEACEYNRFFLSSSMLTQLNALMLVRFAVPPRFIPGRNRPICLDMTGEELERKLNLFCHYRSQKPEVLVQLFGFPDQFRVMERYDYSRGPYDPAFTLRYRICRLAGASPERCNPFDYGISLRGYAELYGRLEKALNAA